MRGVWVTAPPLARRDGEGQGGGRVQARRRRADVDLPDAVVPVRVQCVWNFPDLPPIKIGVFTLENANRLVKYFKYLKYLGVASIPTVWEISNIRLLI